MIMANGSILVVGGESGSNGPPVPTIEILPTPAGGPTWLYMDWLESTDPYNLYPFLSPLPGGGIFVLYHNQVSSPIEPRFGRLSNTCLGSGSQRGQLLNDQAVARGSR